ncbi:helix-turn-helix transcriptional regulator [Paractinoplanes brasiliensis]|uniref:Helix-turn-helix protein n=1 Tax=Paractinoplanes brasiliensis TaxID=52695 RepID=A0A4R6JDQ7_9ACTN|nr:helix-turn-helix transcriptional regulator [Actinoplanes brasiliensis]TDO32676.1 helix-turn-helix protein [Actinoplanes brasiliensis]GID32808.1 transcriptional regulator [Actinoplanes brasiliensis]
MPHDRSALGAFLRSRRDSLTPAQAGIEPFPGARRVPGLRKEELALLAGVSPDYYSRLEQGRQANVSDSVLDALARALCLDDVERAHLADLANPVPGVRRRGTPEQRPDPSLLRVMTALEHVPVLLLGRRGEVLAGNALLTAVLGRALSPGTSFTRFLLQDPVARARIVNWVDFAEWAVAALRRETSRLPGDRALEALVTELRRDPQVDAWWRDHRIRDFVPARKQIDHPRAGRLSFQVELLIAPHDPHQRMVVYTVQPDSETAGLLPLLAAWGVEADAASQ